MLSRFSKIVSFMLVMAMIASTSLVKAAALPTLIEDEPFTNFQEGHQFQQSTSTTTKNEWLQVHAPKTTVADYNGNNVMALNQYNDTAAERNVTRYYFDSVSETDNNYRVKYEYDICPDPHSKGGSSYVRYILDTSESYSVMFNGGKIYLGKWGDGKSNYQGEYEQGDHWYHVEAIVDLQTDTSSIKITSDAGKRIQVLNKAFNTGTADFADTACKGISIWASATADAQVYIDNFKVTAIGAPKDMELAEGAELMLISDDFEDYLTEDEAFDSIESSSGWYEKATPKQGVTDTVARHSALAFEEYNQLLKINHDEGIDNTSVKRLFNAQSFRKVKMALDVKTEEGLTHLINIQNSHGGTNVITFGSDENVYLLNYNSNKKGLIGPYTPNEWYHLEFEIDAKTLRMNYSLTGAGHTYKGYDINIPKYYKEFGYTELKQVRGIENKVWGTAGKAVYIDNVEAYIEPEFTITKPTVLLEEAGGSATIAKSFETVVDGVVKYQLSVKTGSRYSATKIYAKASPNTSLIGGETPLIRFYDSSVEVLGTKIGSYTANETYDIIAELDLDNKLLSVQVSKDGASVCGTSLVDYTADSLSGLYADSDLVSDVKVTCENSMQILPEEIVSPAVDTSKISFYSDGTQAVPSAQTDEIKMNFGTLMDVRSLRDVKIKNISQGKEVLYEISKNTDGTYSCVFINPFVADTLLTGCKYSLTIPQGVKSMSGGTLLAPLVIYFETAGEEVSASIDSVTSGGQNCTLAELAKDELLTATISYTNNCAVDQKAKLMVCYYSNNELKAIGINDVVLSANAVDAQTTSVHSLKNLEGIDKLSVMLWGGETIAPLSDGFINIE